MCLWGVYLLACADGTLYCGITTDMDQRLAAHNAGRGAKYTRGRLPVSLVAYSGGRFAHGEALKRERAVKRLPRHRKAAFVRHMRSSGGRRASANPGKSG